jgi:glycosyltransferase involved in cell wall biosynthesis
MKILLVTDIPPCKNLTAGLVLDQLCRFLPKDSIACFAVVNPALKCDISSDLSWIPVEYIEKPREDAVRILPGRLGSMTAILAEKYNSTVKIKQIIEKGTRFGRTFGADLLWCVLQGQTMIRLANPLAKGLNVPLLTQVWDPPDWWMRSNMLDSHSVKEIMSEFESVLRNSSRCAAASWAMAEQYNSEFGIRAIPVIPSLSSDLVNTPQNEMNDNDELLIGMAGQIYASEEWNSLITALDSVNWEINDRKVKIRLMGRNAALNANGKMNVEFLGWNPQEETIRLMSECDVLYCPYWFDPVFEKEARLSFPSKLTTYLAAGRPVLFHGPEYASPSRFLRENEAGMCCHSLEKENVIQSLKSLTSNQQLYYKLAGNGVKAFLKYLTLSSMRKSFAEFLQVEEDYLLPIVKETL